VGYRRAADRLAVLHDDSDEAVDATDVLVGLGIEDVDALVRAVGEVIAAGRRIDSADIEKLELLARDVDGGQQLYAGREGIAADDDGRKRCGCRKCMDTLCHIPESSPAWPGIMPRPSIIALSCRQSPVLEPAIWTGRQTVTRLASHQPACDPL